MQKHSLESTKSTFAIVLTCGLGILSAVFFASSALSYNSTVALPITAPVTPSPTVSPKPTVTPTATPSATPTPFVNTAPKISTTNPRFVTTMLRLQIYWTFTVTDAEKNLLSVTTSNIPNTLYVSCIQSPMNLTTSYCALRGYVTQLGSLPITITATDSKNAKSSISIKVVVIEPIIN